MAFAWNKTREPLGDAVRATRAQVADAVRGLRVAARAGDPSALARAVHEARKSLRRARALVDLLRPLLGAEAASDLAAGLRDARRHLSDARDATVVVAALRAAWKERAAGAPAPAGRRTRPPGVAALRARLVGDRDAELAGVDAAAAITAVALLHDVQARLRAVAVATADGGSTGTAPPDAVLRRGLSRQHRRALAATRAALARPDDERLHDARKRWKELGYVMRWWAPAWPRVIEPWLVEVDALGDLIGEHHDQAVLRARLGEPAVAAVAADAAGGDALVAEVRARSERRGARLRARALPVLARLAAEPTDAFVARHLAYLAAAAAGPC